MPKITPFLWFETQAEQAAKYYVSVFKKDSKILSIQRYGAAGPGKKGSVMTVEFKLRGQRFIALNGGPEFKFNSSISFMVDCKDQKEIDYYWQKLLADGGQESMCGWLKDKYGLSWQVTPTILLKMIADKNRKKAKRAMDAMMQMRKIDIRKLQEAYKGEVRG